MDGLCKSRSFKYVEYFFAENLHNFIYVDPYLIDIKHIFATLVYGKTTTQYADFHTIFQSTPFSGS